jgi:hypothetical protein
MREGERDGGDVVMRKLFTLAAAVSAALCVAIVWLSVEVRRVGGVRPEIVSLYAKSRHARYTLQSEPRGLVVYGPPVPTRSASLPGPRSAAALAAQLRNGQLHWEVWLFVDLGSFRVKDDPFPEWAPLYSDLQSAPREELIPHLLEAMEDPDRIVAARYLLVRRAEVGWVAPGDTDPYPTWPPAGSFAHQYGGLRVVLSQLEASRERYIPADVIQKLSCRVEIDPAQFPAVRAHWHRLLDEPVAVVSYPAAIAGASLLPGIWCGTWCWRLVQRRRSRRGNCCVKCGYDLRATPDCCPECGDVPAARRDPLPQRTRN